MDYETKTIEELTELWKQAKVAEKAAQETRYDIEAAIFKKKRAELPEKGTTTLDTGLKIVTGYTEKWDNEKLTEIYRNWTAPVPFPFKGEWKPDGKGLTYIKENLPAQYKPLHDALVVTEKKPAFSLKE